MSTIEFFTNSDELKSTTSAVRATITAPFFANNVIEVKNVSDAYFLAKQSPGTVELTGMPVFKPEKIGLPKGANQLLFNDGTVVGRCAAARKIVGEPNCDVAHLLPIIREAVYLTRYKQMHKAQVVVGLDEDFMIKAHLLIPQGYENNQSPKNMKKCIKIPEQSAKAIFIFSQILIGHTLSFLMV